MSLKRLTTEELNELIFRLGDHKEFQWNDMWAIRESDQYKDAVGALLSGNYRGYLKIVQTCSKDKSKLVRKDLNRGN